MPKKPANTLYPGKARDLRTVAARLNKAIKGQQGINPDFSPYQSGLWHGYEAVIKCLQGQPMAIRESPAQWEDKNQISLKEFIEMKAEANHLKRVAFEDVKAAKGRELIVQTSQFFNGIECILSIFERREPRYMSGVTPVEPERIPIPTTQRMSVAEPHDGVRDLKGETDKFLASLKDCEDQYPRILMYVKDQLLERLSLRVSHARDQVEQATKLLDEAIQLSSVKKTN